MEHTQLAADVERLAKSYYYTLMGWDTKTGIPTPEKLRELGIECVAEYSYSGAGERRL